MKSDVGTRLEGRVIVSETHGYGVRRYQGFLSHSETGYTLIKPRLKNGHISFEVFHPVTVGQVSDGNVPVITTSARGWSNTYLCGSQEFDRYMMELRGAGVKIYHLIPAKALNTLK